MKKDERLVYVSLAEEICATLCTFCRYSAHESEGCCEGYNMCCHPIESLCWMRDEGLEPGDDCWGLSPSMPLNTIIDLVGSILSEGYREWGFMMYSRTALTVYGRSKLDQNKTSKVRIGHQGKTNEETRQE